MGCNNSSMLSHLTHWGPVTHICVSKLTIIASDNGLSPGRRQAIIKTNAGILLIGPLGTNISEILIEIQTFSLKKMFENVVCEMLYISSRPQCVKPPLKLGHGWVITPTYNDECYYLSMVPRDSYGDFWALNRFKMITTSSHHLIRGWLIAKCVLWHSHESSFIRSAHELNP